MLTVSTACTKTLPEEFVIYGERGMLNYRTLSRWARYVSWRHRGLFDPLRFWLGGWRLRHQGGLLGMQITDVVRGILTDTPPAVSVRDGYNALRFVKLCENAVTDTTLLAQ